MWAGEWVGREEMEQTLQTALSRNQVVKGKGSRRCQERSRMDGAFFFFFSFIFSVFTWTRLLTDWTFLVAQTVKHLPTMRQTLSLIPGLGRSSGEGNGNPL